MKINIYLEELLGSKVKIKILRALAKFETKSFTSRELAKSIKVSHTAVIKSLDDLKGINVVGVVHPGTSNIIKLNKESYLTDIIMDLFNYERMTLISLKKDIAKGIKTAKKIALFGSIAEKKEKLNSDIDILIIAKNKEEIMKLIAEKQNKFSKKFGNIISAYILTENEFKKNKNTDLIKNIIKRHIMIKGDSL